MAGAQFPSEGTRESVPGVDEDLLPEREHLVRAHLEEILASPEFLKSRRLREFLRFIVQRTLDGHASELKERVIGMEVFGRGPDYDTAADHSVRVAASDLRRRLAQYYLEHGAQSRVRIELQPGSYVPQFRFNGGEAILPAENGHDIAVPASPATPLWHRAKTHLRPGLVAVALIIIAGAFAAFFGKLGLGSASGKEALNEFWRPLVTADERVLVCVGEAWHSRSANRPPISIPEKGTSLGPVLRSSPGIIRQSFHATDAVAGASAFGVLRSLDAKPILCSDTSVTLTELKESPAVFVGLLNNVWSRRLMEQMRFRVTWDNPKTPANSPAILDYGDPEGRGWEPEVAGPNADPLTGEGIVRDYGVIARLRLPQTGRPVVLSGGILGYGTLAAAEFLSDGEALRSLLKAAPSGWRGHHLEAVIAVDIVNGAPGRPRLVVAHFR